MINNAIVAMDDSSHDIVISTFLQNYLLSGIKTLVTQEKASRLILN